MTQEALTILFVGATGSVGRPAITEALRQGHTAQALVRNERWARILDDRAQVIVGDLTRPETLTAAVDGVDAVVFTHGAPYGSSDLEAVDYAGVRNILTALHGRRARIALMTAIGVTARADYYDWKRRSERLVRASGNPYTIVRPGWFDYNDKNQLQITLLQGDTRHAGNSSDGVIARHQIARVLIDSLTSDDAANTAFELVAEHGPEQPSRDSLFGRLDRDPSGGIDGVRDQQNLPLATEPGSVVADLEAFTNRT
ncbi:SDR family oxidoreductase [Arthrobacter sp. Alg241-R88]|uniref:SDR family oxidoreductase n=1 Tax=Arthrobacter sp. Alg241-R88 TaxID=2305984 RepID=UPI0013D0B502|nr:SDR family oxidoreductase [Arthrobacter sp. Alg241-R88]